MVVFILSVILVCFIGC